MTGKKVNNNLSNGVKKLKPIELRNRPPTKGELKKIKKNPIYIIIDNVLDTYNIGAIFRLADATACEKVILCGDTEIPPNTKIKRASINTTEWVEWSYAPTAVEALQKLKIKNEKLKIVAIEQDPRSVPYTNIEYSFPLALVVGHETRRISKDALDVSDAIVELPMFGINNSMNVMVSLGIVLYKTIEKLAPS